LKILEKIESKVQKKPSVRKSDMLLGQSASKVKKESEKQEANPATNVKGESSVNRNTCSSDLSPFKHHADTEPRNSMKQVSFDIRGN
jgi:hypothetical protein